MTPEMTPEHCFQLRRFYKIRQWELAIAIGAQQDYRQYENHGRPLPEKTMRKLIRFFEKRAQKQKEVEIED